MAAPAVTPFAFARDFTGAVAPQAMNAFELEREVTHLRAEVDRLRRIDADGLERARAEAFDAGRAQARAEIEAALLVAVDSLQASLEAVEEDVDAIARQTTRDAAEVALAAADLIAGRALERAPEATIDAAIGRVLEQAGRGVRLGIRVHPVLVERIETIVADRAARDRRRLTLNVIGDPSLGRDDAFIFWDKGGLQLDAAQRRAKVLDELGPLLGD